MGITEKTTVRADRLVLHEQLRLGPAAQGQRTKHVALVGTQSQSQNHHTLSSFLFNLLIYSFQTTRIVLFLLAQSRCFILKAADHLEQAWLRDRAIICQIELFCVQKQGKHVSLQGRDDQVARQDGRNGKRS